MVMRKTMTNLEIYNIASAILENFNTDLELPVKVNFYLQKNITAIVDMAKEIEKTRMDIFDKYGTKDEESNQYHFEDSVVEIVNKEVSDLLNLEQEVKVYVLNLDWFNDLTLSSQQVSAISYMFEDEE